MPFRYVPMLRSKAGEIVALENLTPIAKQRLFPVIHVVANPPATFVQRFAQAWTAPVALDGLFNFALTGSATTYTSMFTALRHAGVSVVPSIECDADLRYVTAARRFISQQHPYLVVKASLAQLPTLQAWMAAQGLQAGNVDLVILSGHVADYGTGQFASYVSHVIQQDLPTPGGWRSVTLASSAAPKDTSALQVGRNQVPRLDWALWQSVHGQLNFPLDYGDYGTSHPDLTEPPGIAMARATVSVRYTVDDNWIVLKGRPISGASGQPMANQYRRHAQALTREAQFGQLQGCWADQRINQIATQPAVRSGSRTTWVEFAANRHLSLVADRLP